MCLFCLLLILPTCILFYSDAGASDTAAEDIYRPVKIVSQSAKSSPVLVVIKKNKRCLLTSKYRIHSIHGNNFVVFSPKDILFDDLSFLYKSRFILFDKLLEPVEECTTGKKVYYE